MQSKKQKNKPSSLDRNVIPFPEMAKCIPKEVTFREFLEGEPLFIHLRRYLDWSNVSDWAFYLAAALGLGGLLLLLALLLLLEILLKPIL